MKVKYRKVPVDCFWLIVIYSNKLTNWEIEHTSYGAKVRAFSVDRVCIAYVKYNSNTGKVTHYAHPSELL